MHIGKHDLTALHLRWMLYPQTRQRTSSTRSVLRLVPTPIQRFKRKDLESENCIDFKGDETRILDVCKLKRTKKAL